MDLVLALCTHKHWDHAWGNAGLRARFPRVVVVGGENDAVPGGTKTVADAEVLQVGNHKVRGD